MKEFLEALLEATQRWSDKWTIELHQSIQTFRDDEPLECRACKRPYPCPELLEAIKRQRDRGDDDIE